MNPTFVSASPDGQGDALFSASVRQDIAGIDLEDPEVELSLSGPLTLEDDVVSGDVSLRLEFAGRRFETDARSFDILDDLTETVVITNQDGVTLDVSENEAGRLTGTLALGDELLATITESASGIVTVDFVDDTFVSIL